MTRFGSEPVAGTAMCKDRLT